MNQILLTEECIEMYQTVEKLFRLKDKNKAFRKEAAAEIQTIAKAGSNL